MKSHDIDMTSSKRTRINSNIGQYYRLLYNTCPDPICTLDNKGVILDVNKRAVEYFGYKKKEVIGKSCFDFVLESYRKMAVSAFEILLKKDKISVDLFLVKKNGTKFSARCIGVKISSEQYLIVVEDISPLRQALEDMRSSRESIRAKYEELKVANKQLHDTKSRYENLYESSPDMLRTIDVNERILECNKTYLENLGYAKEEVIGKSIFEHTAEQSHETMKYFMQKWKRSGKIINSQIWMKRKDSTIFLVLLSGTNLCDEGGRIIGRTVSLRDITDLYKSRRALEAKDRELKRRYDELKDAYSLLTKAEEKYHSLYDNSPLLYRTIDTNGIIRDYNKSYAISLGYSKEEIVGCSIFDHVSEKSRDELVRTFHIWRTEGKTGERLIWLKRNDGKEIPSMLQAASLYNDKGELIGSNTIIRDVSETYTVKQQLEQEKIKKLSALGELAARIAHDMRNPMGTIRNAMNLIKMQYPDLDENMTNKFVLIDEAITRMSHQIYEVLDFVSPKPPRLVRTDTAQILQNVVDRLIVPPTVQVKMPDYNAKIICEPYKMEIVLVNVVTNAMQAMEYKGTITMGVSENEARVIFTVKDTGPGIPKEQLSQIFDPLFTTKQVGTGLGLTSCKSIIEQHGGSIDVNTQVGKGTIFTIGIPKQR